MESNCCIAAFLLGKSPQPMPSILRVYNRPVCSERMSAVIVKRGVGFAASKTVI